MDPISIAAGTLGAKFLEEGVKFLWAEAGKILDRYHKRREASAAAASELEKLEDPAPAELELPPVRRIDFGLVERREARLASLRRELSPYFAGVDPITLEDAGLLTRADELQALIAEILRLPPPTPGVDSRMRIGTVEEGGSMIGVDLEGDPGTSIRQHSEIDSVKGTATGVKYRR